MCSFLMKLGKPYFVMIAPWAFFGTVSFLHFDTFTLLRKEDAMETRIALIGIIVETPDSVESLNAILHDYSEFIIGRMGIPYKQRNVSVISVIVDAPTDVISALSGKLGMLPNVNAKTVYSKLPSQ